MQKLWLMLDKIVERSSGMDLKKIYDIEKFEKLMIKDLIEITKTRRNRNGE